MSAPFDLPPFHAELRAEAQELAARFATRHREMRLYPFEHGELHPELWAEIRERGWAGLLMPPAHGGSEGGLLAYVVVMEALAASNLILWMPVLTAAIGHAIAEVGPEHARERWLERIASGETFLALAVTEPQCGHNVFRSKTTVRREGERFVVNGLKAVTSGIDLAERVLVFGRTPREEGTPPQFTTVLVDPDSPGVEREELPMRGREGARQFQLTFTDVEVPLEELVGAEGQGLLAVYRAAQQFDAGADTIAVAGEANMAKLLSADLLFDSADHAMQTLGGGAWDEREGMIDLYLDARLARSAPISQELALNFIAQHVLGLPGNR
jgi:alkylation response protein AidB-like acyl-CoA dehydrogenase